MTILCQIINIDTMKSLCEDSMKIIKKPISIKRKILILTAGLMGILAMIIFIVGYIIITAYTEDILNEKGTGMAVFGASMVPPQFINEAIKTENPSAKQNAELKNYVNYINNLRTDFSSAQIILYDQNKKEYKILCTSDGFQPNGIQDGEIISTNDQTHPLIQKVIEGDSPQITSIYKGSSHSWVEAYAAIDGIEGDNRAIYAVTIDAGKSLSKNLYWEILFAGSILVFFSIVYFVIHYYLNKLMRPVNKLIKGIKKVSEGDFNVNLKEESSTDFKELFDRFNHMVDQLHILFEKLSMTSKKMGAQSEDEMLINNFDEAIKEIDNIVYKTNIQKELQQAEKMNAIGQLAASVAHEIRNPMTVVKGFLQIFQNKNKLSEEELSYIKLMVDEMNRAEGIINDYLSLAKPDLGSKERVMLSEFSANIIDLMNGYALMVSNIHLHFKLDFDMEICLNTNEVKQVLINIIKNGIEAMKDGGEMTLSIQKEGEYLLFSISDTGTGMSEEQIARLGTAFYSLKDQGTGIGLMVCYQVIERMKGKIEVESEKNIGTTFKVYVPYK